VKRVQPTLYGGAVTTFPPTGRQLHQARLPGLDGAADRQLEADAVRLFLERLRASELPELDDYTPETED
jgi:hypothetical protein